MTPPNSSDRGQQAAGLAYTLGAFLIWALGPLFWKAVQHVDALQLLAHRVVWAVPMLAAVIAWQKRWDSLGHVLRKGRIFGPLVGTTALIAGNWYLYIWAVNSGHVLEASLGYFINPLISVVFGLVFLGERLSRWQTVAVGLAAAAVLFLTVQLGEMPWISLGLAFSFGLYALLRKQIPASPEEGMFIEICLMTPFLGGWLIYKEVAGGGGSFGHADTWTHVFLIAAGAMTAVPLILFHHGAKRLPLSTVGLLQYSAPTGQFLLAVFAFKEPFTWSHGVAFAMIWAALAIFTVDLRRRWNEDKSRRQAEKG